jgi:hypothetical protein
MNEVHTDPTALRYSTLDDLWSPPAPSLSTRDISARSQGSGRATKIGGVSPRQIRCESGLEAKALTMLLARRDVVDVHEQPTKVTYIDTDQVEREHTFDFLATMADGRKLAIQVKPAEKVQKYGWKALIERIATHGDGTADGYLLVTEKQIPPYALHNAKLIRAARRGARSDHDDVIRGIVVDINGRVKIADIVALSGLEGEGFRAIVRLIDLGELTIMARTRIDYPALVMRGASMVALQ